MSNRQKHKMQKRFLKAYEKHSDALFRHCYFRLRNDREKAKEVVQQTYMKTWEAISDGKEIKNLRAYLYRVATNLIIDDSRRKKEASLDDMLESGFQPAERIKGSLENVIDGDQLIQLLDHLDEKHRTAVTMRYVDDLSPKEIAAILNERENTISVRIHRGLAKLKNVLQEHAQATQENIS